jgi:hypothetical protein
VRAASRSVFVRLFLASVYGVAFFLATSGWGVAARAEPLAAWTHAAPGFFLPTLEGGLVAPGRARGRVAVVHFFKANGPERQGGVAAGLFWGAVGGFISFVSYAGAPPVQVYLMPQRSRRGSTRASTRSISLLPTL